MEDNKKNINNKVVSTGENTEQKEFRPFGYHNEYRPKSYAPRKDLSFQDDTDDILGVTFTVLNDDNFGKRYKTVQRYDYNKRRGRGFSKSKKTRSPFAIAIRQSEISLNEFSKLINIKSTGVIQFLKKNGMSVKEEELLDADTMLLIASHFNVEIEYLEEQNVSDILLKGKSFVEIARPPIVTVVGHVDHGKTTLLDLLRQTKVAEKEAGGITQRMSSTRIQFKDKVMNFIDTPGHAAFQQMRKRSSNIADIAVLIIAADDGINEQTIEIIRMLQETEMPFIVAINKIDKVDNATRSIDTIKTSLMNYSITAEDFGGDVMVVPISAKSNTNIDALLEAILLQYEMLEVTVRADGYGFGQVLDSYLDPKIGVVADVIVKEGIFNRGDFVVSGNTSGKVRIIQDNSTGKNIDLAGPSFAVKIIGLPEFPKAGDFIYSINNKSDFESVRDSLRKANVKVFKERDVVLFKDDSQKVFYKVLLKAESQGTLEALIHAVQSISIPGAEIQIVNSKSGEIGDSDLDFAKITKATIYSFGMKIDKKIQFKAGSLGVVCKDYNVIYHLLEDIKQHTQSLFEPIFEEVFDGTAEIRNIFNISKVGTVYGCMITSGSLKRNSFIKVKRNGKIIYSIKISSLRRLKDDVKEVSTGFECGMSVTGNEEIKIGDIVEAYHLKEVPRF